MHRLMSLRIMALVAAFGAVMATSTAAGAQATNAPDELVKIDGLDVALWLPPASSPKPYPLVLFSHGVLGCKTQSSYLMRALAQGGILVAAPDHDDNRCKGWLPSDLEEIFRIFGDPGSWTDDTFRDRHDDLHALREGLLAHPTHAASLKPPRVALIGHSLGGYTVLALAGARAGWKKMDGIAGVVALAPFVDPFLYGGTPASISVPVLVQAGEVDPYARLEPLNNVYTRIPSPACKVIYKGADHFAWVDPEALPPNLNRRAQPEFQDATAEAVIAFLQDVLTTGRPTEISSSPGAESTCKGV